jgi:hypothetical protein
MYWIQRRMQLKSEKFQCSLEYTDKLNPSVIPFMLNTMNNDMEKGRVPMLSRIH